eukprot:TRINITY_DN1065_c0_g2_i1.p1 TRINITY_DN1065_c0_g2~~TRINITY_DN1065_c0_g2_i1.p1  ORF type:complete len:127 (-),score=29.92 TRINITY_DN1065_c0_g2_i1:167-547(-)
MSAEKTNPHPPTFIQTLFPGLCSQEVKVFVECVQSNRSDMGQCKALFKQIGECTFCDDDKANEKGNATEEKESENPDMTIFGQLAVRHIGRLFNPDDQEHPRSIFGLWAAEYLPRFFTSDDDDDDD